MTFTTILDPRLSDLLIQEKDNYASREVVTVNMAAGATLKQGTVLARAKNALATAAYDIVKTTDLTDSATALGKEYAVLAGDGYSLKDSVTFATTTAKSALVWVRDARFKEATVLAIHDAALNDTEYALLKGAMSKQELLLDTSAAASA
jgi:hypothetical protein